MRKKYKLLKDTPELRAGAIVEEMCDDGTQSYEVVDLSWNTKDDSGRIWYARKVVMEQPEWFEEVVVVHLAKQQIEKLMSLIGL